jgi:phosphopantothenoylcysteine decarboxylase/phosphopantothenoylcysteine decarboxylase/phosphopantothenate--cysteine ligase
MKEIILGITGSIAAYKAADIANELTKSGISVHTIMTKAAMKFITPLTLQTLTKNKVYTDMFEEIDYPDVRHISLAQRAACCLIAPATANIIGKLASGIADDMLSTVGMAVKGKPVVICPAMNTAMYENPVTQANIERLKGFGYLFIDPKEALLACGDLGRGALADVSLIVGMVKDILGVQSI